MPAHAIACGHRVTVEAAEATLDQGGNAVDAVIAGALAAMVAEPVLAGLLGGGFLTVREAGGKVRVLDFFVQTPRTRRPEGELDIRAISARFGTADQVFHVGAGTVATPGVASGLAEAWERLGKLPMREIAAPAAKAARDGVPVSAFQAQLGRTVAAILTDTPEARALFCEGADKGAPMPEGTLWRNSDLGDVIEVFAHEGARFVTEGEVAQALCEAMQAGGHLERADLANYQPVWRDPIQIARGSARISLNPPPAMGGVLVAMALGLAGSRPGIVGATEALEATTMARLEAAIDGEDRPEALLDPALLERWRKEVRGEAAALRGTTHISVIDGAGMAAGLTLSNGSGSGLIVPGTGIMANNMLGEEDLLPAGLERWRTDRRLSSMMCPSVVEFRGGQVVVLGSGGSNRIRSALAQVMLGIIDFGVPPDEAVDAARAHVEYLPGEDPEAELVHVDFEDVAGEEVRERMLKRWPGARAWPERSLFFGGVHVASRGGRGDMTAAGDPRRDGVARVRQNPGGAG